VGTSFEAAACGENMGLLDLTTAVIGLYLIVLGVCLITGGKR
jgi:hypothetical protein